MSERVLMVAQAARAQFLQLAKGLSYEYLGPGEAIDNAHNDIYRIKGWAKEHDIVIQVIDREKYCSLLFNVINYFFEPQFADEPFFRQLTADMLEIQKKLTYDMQTGVL